MVATLHARLSYGNMRPLLRYRAVVQRAAVRWMLAREETCGPIPDPCWRALQTGDGLPFWICSATGDFRSEEPRQILDRKGGLFCDEPVSHSSEPYSAASVTYILCGEHILGLPSLGKLAECLKVGCILGRVWGRPLPAWRWSSRPRGPCHPRRRAATASS